MVIFFKFENRGRFCVCVSLVVHANLYKSETLIRSNQNDVHRTLVLACGSKGSLDAIMAMYNSQMDLNFCLPEPQGM